MENIKPDETKLQIVMEIIESMSSLAMSYEAGMDEEGDKLFVEKMDALDRQLKEAIGKGMDECELFLDYQAYTTLEKMAKRVLLPPEKSDLVQHIETRLSAYEFKFVKYQDGRWLFRRVMDKESQYVVIQGNFSHEFVLEIYSDSKCPPLRIREITNYDPAYASDFIRFNSEEERSAALDKIADIVIKYGIDKLNEDIGAKKDN